MTNPYSSDCLRPSNTARKNSIKTFSAESGVCTQPQMNPDSSVRPCLIHYIYAYITTRLMQQDASGLIIYMKCCYHLRFFPCKNEDDGK